MNKLHYKVYCSYKDKGILNHVIDKLSDCLYKDNGILNQVDKLSDGILKLFTK